jgi:hypothetical protein
MNESGKQEEKLQPRITRTSQMRMNQETRKSGNGKAVEEENFNPGITRHGSPPAAAGRL